jgi:hypothetical protein
MNDSASLAVARRTNASLSVTSLSKRVTDSGVFGGSRC